MIEFKQKQFAEYDAMRSLYVELMKDFNWRQKIEIIDDTNKLIPILKGNNVVIERFVISTSKMHTDKYRMYLKIGARAKLPEDVRLPGKTSIEHFGNLSINIGAKANAFQRDYSEVNGIISQKSFTNGKGDKDKKGGNFAEARFNPGGINIERKVTTLLGETLDYNKRDRSLVLEFETIRQAIDALNVLPFGINYKLYLLDV